MTTQTTTTAAQILAAAQKMHDAADTLHALLATAGAVHARILLQSLAYVRRGADDLQQFATDLAEDARGAPGSDPQPAKGASNMQTEFTSQQAAEDYRQAHQLHGRVAEPLAGSDRWALVFPLACHVEVRDGAPAEIRVAARLEYLRGQLRAGCASYGELAELQDLAPHIAADDVELREAAGLPEFAAEEATHTAGPLVVEETTLTLSAPPRVHTAGRLAGTMRSYREPVASIPADTLNREANAARLAAAWNACEGISTEELQRMGASGIEAARKRRQAEKRALRIALQELIHGAEAMDARLLKLTGSPNEGERGDITRARQALVDCGYLLQPSRELDEGGAASPVFEFDGSRGSLAEYLQANADDAGLCEWLPIAAIGDTYAGCTRVA